MLKTNRLTVALFLIDKIEAAFAHVDKSNDPKKSITFGASFFATNDNCRHEVVTHEFSILSSACSTSTARLTTQKPCAARTTWHVLCSMSRSDNASRRAMPAAQSASERMRAWRSRARSWLLVEARRW